MTAAEVMALVNRHYDMSSIDRPFVYRAINQAPPEFWDSGIWKDNPVSLTPRLLDAALEEWKRRIE